MHPLLVGCVALTLVACGVRPFVAPRWARVSAAQRNGPPRPTPAPDVARWWRVLLHVHSVLNFVWLYDAEAEIVADERRDRIARRTGHEARMRNYDPRAIARLLRRASRGGIDALILTEHNTLIHAADRWLPRRVGRTHLYRQATEWTAWSRGGHALLLGLRELIRPRSSRRARVAQFRRMVTRARSQGATVVVCHPTTPGSPWKKEDFPAGAHAVEVLNSWPFDGRGSEALWHRALRRGARLGAVAGADWHATDGPPVPGGWRHVEVRVPELSETAVSAAIAAGRTVAVDGRPPAPTVRVTVAGRCREGDECLLTPGRPFDAVVEVRRGGGLVLEIYDEASASLEEPAARLPVWGRSYRVALRRTLAVGSRGFVRAALRGIETKALGSPVYLRATERTTGGSGRSP